MANISHFTQTVNGVSTTYDIHDAGAVPRSGGAVMTGRMIGKTTDTDFLTYCGSSNYDNGAFVRVHGKDFADPYAGTVLIRTKNNSNACDLFLKPDGTAVWGNKNLAIQEDTVPRSGGAVLSGTDWFRTTNNSYHRIGGGTNDSDGAWVLVGGSAWHDSGVVIIQPNNGGMYQLMWMFPDGTWTWSGQPCQTASDQRLKQQITEIDDKLLDAWQDVDLVQFKYNDAVDSKGDKARLHTGFVVQQIDSACKKHGVDISQYGLYCHEVYPEETEEVEVEQADGTKVKETKVIREASEHYSLRYTEALIVECKYLRRCVARLTARIEQLEKEQEAGK